MKKKVLFVCIHNSARSQMAEAFLNAECPEVFEAESAGIEPGTLNPVVVRAMAELGFDLSGNRTKAVFDLFRAGRLYAYVIAVCDAQAAERCPVFPGHTERLHWNFPDPSALTGTEEERLEGTRRIRDEIRTRIAQFCETVCASA